MGWGWLKGLAGIGSIIAAPFTAGTSLSWLPAALGGASVAGGLLEGRKGARTQTTSQTPGQFGEIGELLKQKYQQKLTSPSALPAGYETTGIGNINQTYDLINESLRNKLTSRGLTGSPNEAAVMGRSELQRGGDIVRFQNQLPLLERDLQEQDLANAMKLYYGGTGTETVLPGSALGSGLSQGADILAYLYGSGAFGGGGGSIATAPSRNPLPQLPRGARTIPPWLIPQPGGG